MIQSCVEELNAEPPASKVANHYYNQKYNSKSLLQNYLAHPSCSILFWTMMELDTTREISTEPLPKLYITSIDNICGDCIAVPYDLEQNEEKNGKKVFFPTLIYV